MPTFSQLALQGNPATVSNASPNSHSPGQENKTAWSLEVSLDVERAHAVAPGANILLVTTPTAETLGVQGFPQMMAAEDYVVQHHFANVISQSFGAAEQSFHNTKSLLNLRTAFENAAANGVSVFASAGDGGTANTLKAPVSKGGTLIPFPTVIWPASDPLVTSVGGTDLCTNPNVSSRTVDNTDPPAACKTSAAAGQAEVVWQQTGAATGGGFSSVFAEPSYQSALPNSSTTISGMRGVPDIGLNAAPATGVTIYDTLPPDGSGGLICGSSPCSTGWYDIGGTSASSPQWAGIVAIADQANGGVGLGQINSALYKVASNPTEYANDFFDVTVGNNQADPSVAGFPASTGWDPTTGLGTPNAAKLVPDLIAASH
jgi:subtilase family serine protease